MLDADPENPNGIEGSASAEDSLPEIRLEMAAAGLLSCAHSVSLTPKRETDQSQSVSATHNLEKGQKEKGVNGIVICVDVKARLGAFHPHDAPAPNPISRGGLSRDEARGSARGHF
jgi:hypothetical protein